jgi:hypothetical protein
VQVVGRPPGEAGIPLQEQSSAALAASARLRGLELGALKAYLADGLGRAHVPGGSLRLFVNLSSRAVQALTLPPEPTACRAQRVVTRSCARRGHVCPLHQVCVHEPVSLRIAPVSSMSQKPSLSAQGCQSVSGLRQSVAGQRAATPSQSIDTACRPSQ